MDRAQSLHRAMDGASAGLTKLALRIRPIAASGSSKLLAHGRREVAVAATGASALLWAIFSVRP